MLTAERTNDKYQPMAIVLGDFVICAKMARTGITENRLRNSNTMFFLFFKCFIQVLRQHRTPHHSYHMHTSND